MSFFGRIFHRNRDDESEDLSIYKSEPTTNRLASFLFGFFALLVTLLIAAGLFFGARAVYRALDGDSPENVATPQKQTDNNAGKKAKASPESDKKTESSGSTPSTGDNLPSTGDSLPSTGDSDQPESLPKTGDPGM